MASAMISCSATSALLGFAMNVLGLGMKVVLTGFVLVVRRMNIKGAENMRVGSSMHPCWSIA